MTTAATRRCVVGSSTSPNLEKIALTFFGSLQESLYLLGWDFHFKIAYLLPLVLLPAGHVLRRTQAAPAALTWSGLLLGVLALASTLGNLSADTMFVQYPVFMLFLLWMLAAGLVLGLRGARVTSSRSQ